MVEPGFFLVLGVSPALRKLPLEQQLEKDAVSSGKICNKSACVKRFPEWGRSVSGRDLNAASPRGLLFGKWGGRFRSLKAPAPSDGVWARRVREWLRVTVREWGSWNPTLAAKTEAPRGWGTRQKRFAFV